MQLLVSDQFISPAVESTCSSVFFTMKAACKSKL